MNMAGLEQFHQCKSHDETDSAPFEASQNGLKHAAQTLAQAIPALNSESFRESSTLLVWSQRSTDAPIS